jgi:S1-C subfamily serine protease
MKNKKFILTIFFAVFAGVIAGSLINLPKASASFWQDLLNKFAPNFDGGASNPADGSGANAGVSQNQNPVMLYDSKNDYEQSVINAVAASDKSVVSITISENVPKIEKCPYNPYADLPPEFQQFFGQGQFYQQCQNGTELKETGGGSGFIVSKDGLILTNKHVVAKTDAKYTVLTNDGKKYNAKVLDRDPLQDIAIIKIDATGLVPAKLGDSDSIKLGQTAIAIGNSLGEFSNTVSVGVVSGLSRTITASGQGIGQETLRGVIQSDAAINPGNSGGPLLNLKGEVIGINTAMVSGAQSLGFAIPINRAKRDIEMVQKGGVIKAPYLGVNFITLTPELVKKEKLPVENGALVRGSGNNGPGVMINSPAAKAGILAEDIILEINGEKINIDKPLDLLVQKYGIGDAVSIKVQRGNKILNLKAVLEERPKM